MVFKLLHPDSRLGEKNGAGGSFDRRGTPFK